MLKSLFAVGDRVCKKDDQSIQGNVLYAEIRPPHGWLYCIKNDDGTKIDVTESELMRVGVIWREKNQTFTVFTETPATNLDL